MYVIKNLGTPSNKNLTLWEGSSLGAALPMVQMPIPPRWKHRDLNTRLGSAARDLAVLRGLHCMQEQLERCCIGHCV